MTDNPSIETLKNVVEDRIEEFLSKFKKSKFDSFEEEKDIHYSLGDLIYKAVRGRDRFRWEYPTRQDYKRKKGKKLERITNKKSPKPAFIDLAVLPQGDEKYPEMIGIECLFYKALYGSEDKKEKIRKECELTRRPGTIHRMEEFRTHVHNDFEKLSNEKNNVTYGYMLYFLETSLDEENYTRRVGKFKKTKSKYNEAVEKYMDCLKNYTHNGKTWAEDSSKPGVRLLFVAKRNDEIPDEHCLQLPKGWLK